MKKLLRTNNRTRAREKPHKLVHTEEPAPTQPAHSCTTETRGGGQIDPQITSWWERPSKKKTQQEPKIKDIHRANINHSPRSVSSGDQGDCTTESHRYSTTEVYTINAGGETEKLKKQRLTGRVSPTMGRQRNNP